MHILVPTLEHRNQAKFLSDAEIGEKDSFRLGISYARTNKFVHATRLLILISHFNIFIVKSLHPPVRSSFSLVFGLQGYMCRLCDMFRLCPLLKFYVSAKDARHFITVIYNRRRYCYT